MLFSDVIVKTFESSSILKSSFVIPGAAISTSKELGVSLMFTAGMVVPVSELLVNRQLNRSLVKKSSLNRDGKELNKFPFLFMSDIVTSFLMVKNLFSTEYCTRKMPEAKKQGRVIFFQFFCQLGHFLTEKISTKFEV